MFKRYLINILIDFLNDYMKDLFKEINILLEEYLKVIFI